MKSRRTRWSGHVARIVERSGVYRGLVGKREGKDHFGDPSVDGRIILRWIFRKWDVGVWTESSWLRIGTGGGHLWVRNYIFGLHKMRGNFLTSWELVIFWRRALLYRVSKWDTIYCGCVLKLLWEFPLETMLRVGCFQNSMTHRCGNLLLVWLKQTENCLSNARLLINCRVWQCFVWWWVYVACSGMEWWPRLAKTGAYWWIGKVVNVASQFNALFFGLACIDDGKRIKSRR